MSLAPLVWIFHSLSRQSLFSSTDSDYANAAKLAAKTPGDDLRNAETIARFQALPTPQGQASPVLQYFSSLLELGQLNAIESIELVRPVLHQNKKHLLEKW